MKGKDIPHTESFFFFFSYSAAAVDGEEQEADSQQVSEAKRG